MARRSAIIVEFVVESLALFWLCVLIFIWWRPPWFRRIYVSIETKAVLIVRLALLVGLAAFACDVFVHFIRR